MQWARNGCGSPGHPDQSWHPILKNLYWKTTMLEHLWWYIIKELQLVCPGNPKPLHVTGRVSVVSHPPPTPTHWWLWNPTVNHIHICMRSLLTSLKRAMPQRKFYNTKSQYPVHPCWAVINVHCGHLDNNGCRIVQTKAQFDKIKNILCNIYLLLKWADFSGALQRQNPNIQKWNMNNKQICEKLCESYRERTICRLFMARTHRMFMARTKTQTLQWLNNIQIVHGYNNTQAL